MGDEGEPFLELYNGAETELVTSSRSPRPASQTAENITVVTADDIQAVNAHTLADVLREVTGIQLEVYRTPGTVTNFEIEGSKFNHVLVLIDNVPINNLADNYPDINSVPVQIIERIEIVKGAASSSWGNALGGVVNIITKSPDPERTFGGSASASYGKRDTTDARAELRGTVDRFGYYLTAGRLKSDGLLPNNGVDLKKLYGKLQYDLPARGVLTATTGYTDGNSGWFSWQGSSANQDNDQVISTLSLQYPLANRFTLDASLRSRRTNSDVDALYLANTVITRYSRAKDTAAGGSFKLSWLGDSQRVVAGVDYDSVRTEILLQQGGVTLQDASYRADRYGIFLIDTVTAGSFAVTPSARFDHTGSDGDRWSPSIGVTYALTENSVIRGYTARGYSLASLNRANSTEKVWTSQIGYETGEIPYLWLKGTLFRNDTKDIQNVQTDTQRELKEGAEVEVRTAPVHHFSLLGGYTYILATKGNSGRLLAGVPRHSANLGIRYQNPAILNAELTGHYIDWNLPSGGKYDAVIWDVHMQKKISYSEDGSFEVFMSVRNLFNGDQYLTSYLKNPGRWAEAGVRWSF